MLLILISLCAYLPQEYQSFTAKDESFTALFPGTPGERKNRDDGGTTWQVAAQQMVHQVTAGVKAAKPMSPGEKDAALLAVKDGIIKRVEAKVISTRDLRQQEVAAKEFLFQLPQEKGLLRVRCYVLNDTVWQVKVGGSKEAVSSDNANKFLDSLKVK